MTPVQMHTAIREVLAKVNARISPDMSYNVFAANNGGYNIMLDGKYHIFYSDSLDGILGWFSGTEHTLAILDGDHSVDSCLNNLAYGCSG